MTKTLISFVILLNILLCLTQAALVQQQVHNNYQQTNSLEEPRSSSRSRSNIKEKPAVKYNHVLDNFDHRYPDGSYEFRYELADGQARYERGYFITINKHKSLVVVGYYSYRMPNGNYITVFYNADRYGYRQNQAITRDTLPNLPRSIEVPELREDDTEDIETTTKNSYSNPVSTTTKKTRI